MPLFYAEVSGRLGRRNYERVTEPFSALDGQDAEIKAYGHIKPLACERVRAVVRLPQTLRYDKGDPWLAMVHARKRGADGIGERYRFSLPENSHLLRIQQAVELLDNFGLEAMENIRFWATAERVAP